MLTFELVSPPAGGSPEQLYVYCDRDGLETLIAQLSLIECGETEHIHLFSLSWGDGDLADDPYDPSNTPLHHVKVMLRPVEGGDERPLEPEEQALYDAVRGAAASVLDAGAAMLRVEWQRWQEGSSWPTFQLEPTNPDALALGVSLGGGDWIDTTLNVDGQALNFELWAPTFDERLAKLSERIKAVIDGKVELSLRRHGQLLRRWSLAATFEGPSCKDETSRTPADPREYRRLFPSEGDNERADLLGPRRFAAYAGTSEQ
jgi:hypothetical protein